MSIDIKLSKAEISKIIQSGEFLGSLLSKIAGCSIDFMFAGKALVDFTLV